MPLRVVVAQSLLTYQFLIILLPLRVLRDVRLLLLVGLLEKVDETLNFVFLILLKHERRNLIWHQVDALLPLLPLHRVFCR